MQTLSTVEEIREAVLAARGEGKSIGFVPTMGALHAGHLSLVEAAKATCDLVVVSIFVNPKQFSAGEDLDSYPRTLQADSEKLSAAGVQLLYAPTAQVMYPQGFQTEIQVSEVSKGLCGASRPNFFGGIATVVTKLFLQVMPDIAFFGEKDYQQLKLITRLVQDLDIPTRIEGVPIMREADGLAMSSRNVYLNDADRKTATLLYATLQEVAAKLQSGGAFAEAQHEAIAKLEAEGFEMDYLELRDVESLAPVSDASKPARLLIAANLHGTRLIDNIAV